MNVVVRYARWTWDYVLHPIVLLFGLAAIWSVCFVAYQAWRHGQPQPFLAAAPPSHLATQFSDKVSPGMQDDLKRNKESIIAGAGGGMLARAGLRMGWDALVGLVPRILAAAFDVLMDIWGSMNIKQLASMLIEHNRERGLPVHPSVRAAAAAP